MWITAYCFTFKLHLVRVPRLSTLYSSPSETENDSISNICQDVCVAGMILHDNG